MRSAFIKERPECLERWAIESGTIEKDLYILWRVVVARTSDEGGIVPHWSSKSPEWYWEVGRRLGIAEEDLAGPCSRNWRYQTWRRIEGAKLDSLKSADFLVTSGYQIVQCPRGVTVDGSVVGGPGAACYNGMTILMTLTDLIQKHSALLSVGDGPVRVSEEKDRYGTVVLLDNVALRFSYDWRDRLLDCLYCTHETLEKLSATTNGFAYLGIRDSMDSACWYYSNHGLPGEWGLMNFNFDDGYEADASVETFLRRLASEARPVLLGEAFGFGRRPNT